jgi:hypothetical protein
MRLMMSRKASSRIKVAAVLMVVLLGVLGGPSLARSADEKKWRKACTADAFSLCPLQAFAGDRAGVRACLLRKLDKASDACVAVIKAAERQ